MLLDKSKMKYTTCPAGWFAEIKPPIREPCAETKLPRYLEPIKKSLIEFSWFVIACLSYLRTEERHYHFIFGNPNLATSKLDGRLL